MNEKRPKLAEQTKKIYTVITIIGYVMGRCREDRKSKGLEFNLQQWKL